MGKRERGAGPVGQPGNHASITRVACPYSTTFRMIKECRKKGSMANNKMSPHKKQKATTTTTKEQNDKHETQNTKHKTDKKPNHALTFKGSRARSLKTRTRTPAVALRTRSGVIELRVFYLPAGHVAQDPDPRPVPRCIHCLTASLWPASTATETVARIFHARTSLGSHKSDLHANK